MEITIDVYDIINSCSTSEKRELYQELLDERECLSEKEKIQIRKEEERLNFDKMMEILRSMSHYELKKVLCDLLYVPSLHDSDSLRQALEPVVSAI